MYTFGIAFVIRPRPHFPSILLVLCPHAQQFTKVLHLSAAENPKHVSLASPEMSQHLDEIPSTNELKPVKFIFCGFSLKFIRRKLNTR